MCRLCYSETSAQDPKLRLNRFFSSLYSILKRDAKAVLQVWGVNLTRTLTLTLTLTLTCSFTRRVPSRPSSSPSALLKSVS